VVRRRTILMLADGILPTGQDHQWREIFFTPLCDF
jgi:hypothetical protein